MLNRRAKRSQNTRVSAWGRGGEGGGKRETSGSFRRENTVHLKNSAIIWWLVRGKYHAHPPLDELRTPWTRLPKSLESSKRASCHTMWHSKERGNYGYDDGKYQFNRKYLCSKDQRERPNSHLGDTGKLPGWSVDEVIFFACIFGYAQLVQGLWVEWVCQTSQPAIE